jgi:surfeit locus 1 family protein
MYQARRLIPILFMASLGAALLAGLGIWQLQRLAWKNALLANLESGIESAPAPYSFPAPEASRKDQQFRKVTITGRFQGPSAFEMVPAAGRPSDGKGFGYRVFTPFVTAKGTVIVNRGYVPDPKVIGANGADQANGQTSVTGLIRLADKGGAFTPSPKPGERLFFSANIPAMAKEPGWETLPGLVTGEYIEAVPSAAEGSGADWPKPRDPRELLARIPNSHLQYAITWFALAAALAGVTAFKIFHMRE